MHGEPEIKVELALFRTCRLPPQHIYEQIVCKNLVSLYFDHLEHRGKKFINHERIEMIAFFFKGSRRLVFFTFIEIFSFPP